MATDIPAWWPLAGTTGRAFRPEFASRLHGCVLYKIWERKKPVTTIGEDHYLFSLDLPCPPSSNVGWYLSGNGHFGDLAEGSGIKDTVSWELVEYIYVVWSHFGIWLLPAVSLSAWLPGICPPPTPLTHLALWHEVQARSVLWCGYYPVAPGSENVWAVKGKQGLRHMELETGLESSSRSYSFLQGSSIGVS